MIPHATLLWAGLLGLVLLGLTAGVLRHRMRTGTGLGDGGDPALARAIRVHANFAEYVPLALLLLALLEIAGCDRRIIHGLGASLLAARLFHAVGLWQNAGRSPGRAIGFLGTALVVGAASVLAVAAFLR